MTWRNLLKRLTVLLVICAGVLLFSCHRSANNLNPPAARNLTPGLSEDLTALARKHGQHTLVIADSSEGSQEAKNLEELIAKAFEAGNWRVVRSVIPRGRLHGLHCSYPKGSERLRDDLLNVFQQKGLPIKCEEKNFDPAFIRASSYFTLEVGVKS